MATVWCVQCGDGSESQFHDETHQHLCHRCWLENHDMCAVCNGTGEEDTGGFREDGKSISQPCDSCDGSGTVKRADK